MTRRILPFLAAGLIAGAIPIGIARAQTDQRPAPAPMLPPMPSMEGQQGDNGKPVTPTPRKTASPRSPAGTGRAKTSATKTGRPKRVDPRRAAPKARSSRKKR